MKKLYVGNLPFSASEEQLQEWFGQVGVNPSAINLIRDRFTGQSRGFAFIEITNDEEADRAVANLNGQNFGGRNLVVNEARPQTERSGGGGGRGGYGGTMLPGGKIRKDRALFSREVVACNQAIPSRVRAHLHCNQMASEDASVVRFPGLHGRPSAKLMQVGRNRRVFAENVWDSLTGCIEGL